MRFRVKQYEGAIEDYDGAVIRLNPDDASAYNNRGTVKICPLTNWMKHLPILIRQSS